MILPIYRDNLPKQFTEGALMSYVGALVVVALAFSKWSMIWYWWVIGFLCVAFFFIGTPKCIRQWARLSSKQFESKLFWTGWILRVVTAILMYWLFLILNNGKLDFEPADVEWYDEVATFISDAVYNGKLNVVQNFRDCMGRQTGDLSDSGYPIYLGIVYVFVGQSVLLARIVQCFPGAMMSVLIYRIAQRHFDEPTARLAGVMTMFMPNLVMYCGLHLKEVIMTFLTTWFVERADDMLLSKKFDFNNVIIVALIGLSLFTFRTVLAATVFLAMAVTLVLSSSKMMKGWKRTFLIIFSILFVSIAFSGQIKNEVMEFVNKDKQAQQRISMDLRYGAGRGDGQGNKFASKAGAAVFAPLIFTVPFPTMVDIIGQYQKQMLHGGCFVKNMMSGFVIFTMFFMLLSRGIRGVNAEWRKHVLPLAVLCGYLVVLVFSEFAHSERFHQPILPLFMMFAAYGVTHIKPRQSWMISMWCFAVFVMCVGWAYIKIAGRGLI